MPPLPLRAASDALPIKASALAAIGMAAGTLLLGSASGLLHLPDAGYSAPRADAEPTAAQTAAAPDVVASPAAEPRTLPRFADRGDEDGPPQAPAAAAPEGRYSPPSTPRQTPSADDPMQPMYDGSRGQAPFSPAVRSLKPMNASLGSPAGASAATVSTGFGGASASVAARPVMTRFPAAAPARGLDSPASDAASAEPRPAPAGQLHKLPPFASGAVGGMAINGAAATIGGRFGASVGASPAPQTAVPASNGATSQDPADPQGHGSAGSGLSSLSDPPASSPSTASPSKVLVGSTFEWEDNQGAPIQGLTSGERGSACGLIAAQAMQRFETNDPNGGNLADVMNLAVSHGLWSVNTGMYGAGAEETLLADLGLHAHLSYANGDLGAIGGQVLNAIKQGKPVIVSTSRHYFFVEGYANGQFFVGHTGEIMRFIDGNAGPYMSINEIDRAGAGIGAILIPD